MKILPYKQFIFLTEEGPHILGFFPHILGGYAKRFDSTIQKK